MTGLIIGQIVGLLLIIFREGLARIVVQSPNSTLHTRFGQREVQAVRPIYLVFGFLLAATPLIAGDPPVAINGLLGVVGILAAIGAWKLSARKPIVALQHRIKVRPSTKPAVGNSPFYIVLIVLALAVFGSMIVGTLFLGWYQG